jgi:tetratricopeptide (TPR) repeat protein
LGFFSKFTRPAWEKAIEKAEKAARRGEGGVAVRLFDDAIAKAPDEEKGRLTEARAVVAREVYATNLDQGEQRETAGHLERALDHFELALEFAPDDEAKEAARDAVNRMAVQRRDAKDASKSPAFQDEALELDDDQTYGVLIGALPDEVADEYETLDADFRRAFMMMHRGDLDEAIAHFRSVGDDHAPALVELGRCLRGNDDAPGAIEAFAKVEKLRPDWNFARLLGAEACWTVRDLDRAEEFLQNAVDHDDSDPTVYVAICRTAVLRGTPDYGLEAAEAGLELEPTNRALRLLKARLCEMDGRVEEALEGYEKRVSETWRYDSQEGKLFLDYEAALLAAHIYRRTGQNPKRGAELFRALMAVSEPGERWQHELGLAEVLLADGGEKEATGILEELTRIVPKQDKLARCRILSLQGDSDGLKKALAALSKAEISIWKQVEAERGR